MAFATCNPAPFSDPAPDVGSLLDDMLARVNGEEALKKLEATDYEKKATHLKRFLARNQYDLEPALAQWSEWVQWRHGGAIVVVLRDFHSLSYRALALLFLQRYWRIK